MLREGGGVVVSTISRTFPKGQILGNRQSLRMNRGLARQRIVFKDHICLSCQTLDREIVIQSSFGHWKQERAGVSYPVSLGALIEPGSASTRT